MAALLARTGLPALVLACALAAPAALSAPRPAAVDAVPGELIVKYRAGLGPARRARTEALLPGHRLVRPLALIGAEHLRVAAMSIEAVVVAPMKR